MNVKTLLDRISEMKTLAIPKSQHDLLRVVSAFGGVTAESKDNWFVPCSHLINPPASSDLIGETERQLGFDIPEGYKEFLRIADGAKLFIVPRNRPRGGDPHVRFRLFDCRELVMLNRCLLQTFLEAYSEDQEYKDVQSLNYLAFCDAANDNYQAIIVEGANAGRVFLLFNEFQCRPYSAMDSDFYYTISQSLESWFYLILQTGGWEGRGAQSGGL